MGETHLTQLVKKETIGVDHNPERKLISSQSVETADLHTGSRRLPHTVDKIMLVSCQVIQNTEATRAFSRWCQ